MNMFTQLWKTNMQQLPQELKEMLKLAKEFNVSMELLRPSEALKTKFSIWLHTGANDLLLLISNNKEAKCL